MKVSGIELNSIDNSVQILRPPDNLQRFEGVSFSCSGNLLGVATSDSNTIFLYRRDVNGRFEERPYSSLDGGRSKLSYPHDVSFSRWGNSELLAVAQRGGAIQVYQKHETSDAFGPDPVFELAGLETRLEHSDGVAFVPSDPRYLAVCNLTRASISFYGRNRRSPLGFRLEPVFELKHPSLVHPDGLAFSKSGKWLAIANHGNHTVSIFSRKKRDIFSGKIKYGPDPVTIIKDGRLRHPHSLAFTPITNHLVVTNAGANYFNIYEPQRYRFLTRWSQSPVLQQIFGPDSVFKEVNARNKMEGGPKGVAIHKSNLAICSPEYGLKIFSFRELKSTRGKFDWSH